MQGIKKHGIINMSPMFQMGEKNICNEKARKKIGRRKMREGKLEEENARRKT